MDVNIWFESGHLREELSSKWKESTPNGHIYQKFQQSFNTVWKGKWKYLEYIKGDVNGNLPLGIWETGRIQCKESAKSPQEGKTFRKIWREKQGVHSDGTTEVCTM